MSGVSSSPDIRLVAGLGNYTKAYHNTPHNIGRQALDVLAERAGAAWREKSGARLCRWETGAVLLQHETFMNVCGPVIRRHADDAYLDAGRVLVVLDDFALPWGRLRFRRNGSAGGHNGLKSAIESFGTPELPRLRVGVGPVPDGRDPKDYVLGRQSGERMGALAALAADAIASCLQDGFDKAMNRFNAAAEAA